jgi:hypothetical protein
MRKKGRTFTRRIDPLAAFRSADRQHPLDNGQKQTLGVVLRTHLEALRLGQADAIAFHNLASGVNVSMVLAERGLGDGYSELIGGAQQAVFKLKINGDRRGRWLLDGPSLTALVKWLPIYEAQLEACSQQEAMDALDEVDRRVRRGQIFEIQEQAA